MVDDLFVSALVSFIALGVGLSLGFYQMVLARREVSYTKRILELLEARLK